MRVERVSFYGNSNISTRELRKLVSTTKGKPYKEFQKSLDKSRIIDYYKARGYSNVRIIKWEDIINEKKKSVRCKIYIEEGLRIYIKGVKIEGNKLFSSSQIIKLTKLKSKMPFDEGAVFTAKYNIANFYAECGYPYTEVSDSISYVSLYELSVCFYISESHLVRFGNVKLEGRENMRGVIAEREVVFKKGDIYSPKKIYESQAKIYGTELFKSVKFEIPELDKKKDTLDVVFILQREKPRWMAFGGGYVSPGEWFNIGWGNSNLWGNAQKIDIQLDYKTNIFDFRSFQDAKISASYLEPYFFNTSFKAEAQPFYEFYRIEQKDSSYERNSSGVQGKLGKYVGKFCQAFIGYNYKKDNYEKMGIQGSIPSQAGIANSLMLSVDWDDRTDVFYPRRGAISFLSLESGGGFLGGDYQFNKIMFDFAIYSPDFHNTIATRIEVGGITGKIPPEDKFFLGGVNTIRGFPDMALTPESEWKNWIGILSLEFRSPIFKGFELAGFADAGNVWEKSEDIKIDEVKVGVGVGLRYRTPIGPIRLDYGYGLVPVEKGHFYFTLGYMF